MGALKPKISIVIPAATPAVGINLLLNSLREQTDAPPHEIHVVFNPRSGRIENPTLPYENLHLWTHSQRGVNSARNFGASRALGEWIYFLDADCVLTNPKHLAQVGTVLANSEPNTLIGGPYSIAQTANPISRAYHHIQERWVRGGSHPDFGWIHLLGGNLLVSKEVFGKQTFDSEILFGGAEADFIFRWLRSGGQGRFIEDLSVRHSHNLSANQLHTKAFLQGYGYERTRSRRILIDPPRRPLISTQPDALIWVNEYDESFQCGRDYYRRHPNVFPGILRIHTFAWAERLRRRWAHPSRAAWEISRWLNLKK